MNRHFFSLVFMTALFAAMFSSCDQAVLTEENPTEPIPVNLNADIKPVSTYVANDQWEVSDEVGLYMKWTGQSLADARTVGAYNVRMSIVGQTLTSDPPVYYPTSGNVDFMAYHPYTTPVNPGLTIPVNIAGQESGLPVEILYSNNITNQTPTELAVTLNFKYSLAKIELTVTGGAYSSLDSADFSAITVTVEDLYTQANLQLADGTFTDYQEKQPVTLHRISVSDTSATFEALVLPTGEEITFLFNMGSVVYRHKMTANYASDTLYMYSFALDFPYFSEPTATLLNAVIEPRIVTSQQNISVNAGSQMTMTTEDSFAIIGLGGTGKATIDWGDGTSETYTLMRDVGSWPGRYHTYSGTSTHTITIIGENVTILDCRSFLLTSLDVSKNTALELLDCSNNLFYTGQLQSLDVSNNTALELLDCSNNQLQSLDVSISKNKALAMLNCSYNQLTDVALNSLFGTLHGNNDLKYSDFFILHYGSSFKKSIFISNNPGTATCDLSIAEDKGWTVVD